MTFTLGCRVLYKVLEQELLQGNPTESAAHNSLWQICQLLFQEACICLPLM